MSFINPFEPGFYKEKSILNVKDIIEWKRKNNLYNFDTLPKVAVISMVSQLSFPRLIARYPILERKFKLRGDLAYYGIDSFFTKRPCNTTNPARHCFSKFSDFHDGCSSPTYYDVGTKKSTPFTFIK